MLVSLFTWLDNTLNASPLIALLGAFIWGIAGILLSPCHLASIPMIVGFIDGQGRISTRRAFYLSVLFSTGILITIALIGAVTAWLGRIAGDVGPWGNYLVAAVFVIVGLHLLDLIPLPFMSQAGQPAFRKKGLIAALLLGLIFGVALGPCTFAFMAPVLGIAFSAAVNNPLFAIALVVLYALGHVSVIIVAGTFTERVQQYLDWNEKSQGAVILRKICGGLVLLAGLYMLFATRS
jgi:cytochrome c-type biogenesis protein